MTCASSEHLADIACRVLQRFGPANEALAGDLLEEYRQGHSATWYAKEVLVAVAAQLARDMWHYRWLAARALVVGWAALLAYSVLVDQVWGSSELFLTGVTRTHLGSARSVLQSAYLLLAVPGGAAIGWLLSRCHRTRGAAAVVVFVAFLLLWRLPWLLTLLANAFEHPRFLHALLMSSVGTALLSTSILVVGLWHADPLVANTGK